MGTWQGQLETQQNRHSRHVVRTHAWTSYVSNMHKTAHNSSMHIQTLVLLALPASLKVHSRTVFRVTIAVATKALPYWQMTCLASRRLADVQLAVRSDLKSLHFHATALPQPYLYVPAADAGIQRANSGGSHAS